MDVFEDQNFIVEKLSSTSRQMLRSKQHVLAEWEKRTRAASAGANKLRHPILINTLPAYYDNLIVALSPGHPENPTISSPTIASEHGGERARMTQYGPEELVLEYQILRETLLDILAEAGTTPSLKETRTINASIDDSIRGSITAFSLVVTALREQFIAALAHDMRGPLGSVSMAANLIRLGENSVETIELAKRIGDNIKRVDTMVRELLDTMVFERGEKLRLHLTLFDIHDLATEACHQALYTHAKQCEVRGKSVQGWWGQDALKRALENLVDNALKYGRPDTPIKISIDESHGRVLITVHNEGPPIPIESQESIFQIFRRAQEAKDGEQKGWGIGLPFVRAVAESHGGSIAVESSVEGGTLFLIDIPVDCRPYQDAPTLSTTKNGN